MNRGDDAKADEDNPDCIGEKDKFDDTPNTLDTSSVSTPLMPYL
ncbi:hypothetical protein M068_1892 [Bacteroides fragilis str. J38-1]|nr:hypothetical protein [Bacteroides fragilis]EXZ89407.1 hypothetical protein M068_1892 [Bacteroides fragilis str. J38-1]MCS2887923.1 hypothetical protein [Bacteroides fragilis]